MPTITVTKNYSDGSALTETHLDDAFESVETFINTTKLDSNNIQSGGVATGNIADASVTESKLASDAVSTTKILDNNVTGAKLASNTADDSTLTYDGTSHYLKIKDSGVGTTQIAASAVTTAKIADANVTTAKIATGAVTQAKRAALTWNRGGSSDAFTTSSTSYVTVCTSAITTSGRPVLLILQPAGGGISDINGSCFFNMVRGGFGSIAEGTFVFGSGFCMVDNPDAGTYTYTLEVKKDGAINPEVEHYRLVSVEL
jgi:hypothetical protein